MALDGKYAVVGSPLDQGLLSDTGAAYVFERNGVLWPFRQKLTPQFPASEGWFGWSASADQGRLAIGALFADTATADDAGSVSIFRQLAEGQDYVLETELSAMVAESNDQFGYDVALQGNTLLVGSPLGDNDVGPQNSGLVYAFELQDDSWTQVAILRALDGVTGNHSVSASGSTATWP